MRNPQLAQDVEPVFLGKQQIEQNQIDTRTPRFQQTRFAVRGFERFDVSFTAALAFVVIVLLSLIVMAMLKRLEIAR